VASTGNRRNHLRDKVPLVSLSEHAAATHPDTKRNCHRSK
jgi:hypothetical protein